MSQQYEMRGIPSFDFFCRLVVPMTLKENELDLVNKLLRFFYE